jgi:peptidyl-prolyl cis-trans isomerase SurA
MMKRLLPPLLLILLVVIPLALPAEGEIIDRIAAIVEDEAVTTSEISQFRILRIYQQRPDESDEAYDRRILDSMIAQMLRYRDVVRFGGAEVSAAEIESRIQRIVVRFPSEEAFRAALETAEVPMDRLQAIVSRQIQVEAYIEEKFSPTIFVSLEEIERYYRDVWVEERLARDLPLLSLSVVREEIRARLKGEQLEGEISRWTQELRERANVDIYL